VPNFDHFTVKHALKMIATSGFLTALECTQFFLRRGSAPSPLGELTALPRPPSCFKRTLLLRERGEEGKRGEESEGRRGEGKG